MTSSKRSTAAAAILLFALTWLAFLPALRATWIWDDDAHILNNPTLRNVQGLVDIWFSPGKTPQYYPMAHTAYWIEYQLWGLWPTGYHCVNIMLHASSALLLWSILRRLAIPGAWFAALLFAIHPVQVETVAWVMELKSILSGLFYLAAMWLLLRAWLIETSGEGRSISQQYYIAGLVLFALALLSKTVAVTLPAALLLILWWKNGRIRRKDILWTLPLFVIGISLGLFTVHLERTNVGATGPGWTFSLAERLLIAGRAFWFYAGKLAWPHPLIFFYPRWTLNTADASQWLFPAAAVGVVFGLWALRHRLGRGPLTAVLLFAGTLFPALGFFNIYPMRYSFVADHFQYLACIGLLTLFAAVATRLLALLPQPSRKSISLTGSALIAASLIILSFQRCFAYKDAFTLYADIVAQDPRSVGGHALLASEYQHRGDAQSAADHYQIASNFAPNVLDYHEGLANNWTTTGRLDDAQRELEEAISRDPSEMIAYTDPTRATAYNDLAAVYVRKKLPEHALPLYQEALRRRPVYPEAHYNLGLLLANNNQFAAAANEFRAALDQQPQWTDAALQLARCLASLGRLDLALPYFQRAVDLRPDWPDAQSDLARAKQALGIR